MSNWKVSKERIELSAHPNADNLLLGKVGNYQVVVQKGIYNDGDEIVFAPEKSILTGTIRDEWDTYLFGPNKDRVKSIRLRGELSTGIIIPSSFVPNFESYEVGVDISADLGISHYEPPIPTGLDGRVNSFDIPYLSRHDCSLAGIYVKELIQGERIVITEKVHGSQFIQVYDFSTDKNIISSKNIFKQGLFWEDTDDNMYHKGSKNSQLLEKIKSCFTDGVVQIFGELVPVQKGYSYGFDKPSVLIFNIKHNGVNIPYDKAPDELRKLWVNVLYDGPIELVEKEVVLYENEEKGIRNTRIDKKLPESIIELCKGMETISGKQLHIKEGIVISPYMDRNAVDGTLMKLKIINPKYKETGDEIN